MNKYFREWRELNFIKFCKAKDKIKPHWVEFCNVASIHGVRYLSEPKRTLVEKLCWIVVLLISLSCAAMSTWEQYQKFINSPIEEFLEKHYGNLTEIPFPAVTICDNRKSFFHSQKHDDSETKHFREEKQFICGEPHPLSEETNIQRLLMMSPPLNKTCDMTNVFLKKTWTNCSVMFRQTVTDLGVCHTFNMFTPTEIFTEDTEIDYEKHPRSSDWIAEEIRYKPRTPRINDEGDSFVSPFPRRAENELTVTIYNELLSEDLKVLCCDRNDILGFQITLHNPHEVPMVGHRRNIWSPTEFNTTSIGQYFVLPMERKLQLFVEPKLIKANEQLKQFPPSHRDCYFPGERDLAYFKHYSYSNCQLECVTNLTSSQCGCVDYYMPRAKGKKLCNRSNLGCIMTVLENWKRRGGENCSCLNSCTVIEYHAKAWYTYASDAEEIVWNDTSLSVVMGDDLFSVTDRRPLYTKVDFYANCGGLFALFCGMSIISLVEILYHGSFRIIATLLYNKLKKDEK